jgi:hypothetical protein
MRSPIHSNRLAEATTWNKNQAIRSTVARIAAKRIHLTSRFV